MKWGKVFWLTKLISGAAYYLLQAWEWQHHQRTSCRRRTVGCLLLFLALSALACGTFFGVLQIAQAAPITVQDHLLHEAQLPGEVELLSLLTANTLTNDATPRWVFLLIDNSNSNYDRAGVGTDPDFLRIAAARLLLAYLGVADGEQTHYGSVIFFGTTAVSITPPTPLNDASQRAAIFNQIDSPPPLGWTDHAAALELALDQIAAAPVPASPVVLLLTDGKPEWPGPRQTANIDTYAERLRHLAQQMAARDVPLIVVLLATETVLNDAETVAVWRPLWQEMAAMTPGGGYFETRTATDLPAVYHQIVGQLIGSDGRSLVLERTIPETGLLETIFVPADLRRITFIIRKSQPDQTVRWLKPNDQPLQPTQSGIRFAAADREEIWSIDNPLPGQWRLEATGHGALAVWQDYHQQTTATPTIPPSPTPELTPLPTTPTPLPTLAPTSVPISVATSTTSQALVVLATPNQPALLFTAVPVISSTPITPPLVVTAPDHLRNLPWLALLLLPLLLLGGWYWQVRQQPTVSGTLRLLAGPGATNGQYQLDMDAQPQRRLAIGPPGSDWPLLDAISQATITPGVGEDDVHPMWLIGEGNVSLNGQPLQQGHRYQLADADLITLDQHRLRYENLQLNRPVFQPAQSQILNSQFRGGMT